MFQKPRDFTRLTQEEAMRNTLANEILIPIIFS